MAGTTIEDVRIYKVTLDLRHEFRIATMNINRATNVLVRIITESGIEGWGESSPFHALTGETQAIGIVAARELRRIVVGRDATAVGPLVREMEAHLPHNSSIRAAFDIALHDVASQSAELPLYAFLGGEERELETDLTIGICRPDEAAERAREIVSMGFRIIKIKLGLDDEEDRERLAKIREAVGDKPVLRIDANQGWNRETAVKNLSAFEKFNIEFCEQPCVAHDYPGLKYIGERVSIPVMADESLFTIHDATRLVAGDIVRLFNIKLAKCGGIRNAVKVAAIAEGGSVPAMVGCMSESRLGLTASAHFALSSHVNRFLDLDSHYEHASDPIEGGLTVKDGIVRLPDGIGIGAVPRADLIQEFDDVTEDRE